MALKFIRQNDTEIFDVYLEIGEKRKKLCSVDTLLPFTRFNTEPELYRLSSTNFLINIINVSKLELEVFSSVEYSNSYYGELSVDARSHVLSLLNNNYDNMYEFYNDNTLIIKHTITEFELPNNRNLHVSEVIFDSTDFYTDLYPELLNNYEQASMAQSFLNDTDPQKELDPDYWTDKYLAFCKFVEDYNKNVLLLRSTRKVDASVSGSISQSGGSVNLSGVETKLQNINTSLNNIKDNLQYTDTDDITKGLAQIEQEKDNSVLVQNNMVESAPFNPHLQKNDLFEG